MNHHPFDFDDDGLLEGAEPLCLDSCPDCSAERDPESGLCHDESCPIGRGIDEITAADREFFEAHPKTSTYWRKPAWAELAELRAMDDSFEEWVGGRVRVVVLGEGVRARFMDGLVFVGQVD